MTDHLEVKNMIMSSKLLSYTVVCVSNKIIKRAEKNNLQTQIEAAKAPEQEKTSNKHRIMCMVGSASSKPGKEAAQEARHKDSLSLQGHFFLPSTVISRL